MAISKQTYGINKRLLPEYEDWQITYVPHGIDANKYFPIDSFHPEYEVGLLLPDLALHS